MLAICLMFSIQSSVGIPIPSFASIKATPDSFEDSGGIVTAEWRVHFPRQEKYFIGVYLASEDVLNTAPIKYFESFHYFENDCVC